jgi:magnesium transporter
MTAGAEPAARVLAADYLHRYPDEVARLAESWPVEDAVTLFADATVGAPAAAFERLTPDLAVQVLARLEPPRAAAIVVALDPGRGAVLLSRLEPDAREACLGLLPAAAAAQLRELMAYPPDSAGALMDVHVVTVRPEATAQEALTRLRLDPRARGAEVAVVDDTARLVGLVPIEEVALAAPDLPLRSLGRGTPVHVESLAPREDVIELLSHLGRASLPVVDAQGRVVGIIRQSALVRVAEEEASVDMQTMVGASAEERALSPVGFAVRKRLPWLEINLVTAFLAAAVVGLFEETIARTTALAVLLPVVAGQSGNTGAQALAVTMRGLALREVRLRHWARVLVKEGAVALFNGIGVAATTAVAVYIWSDYSTGLATVIGTSMVISMVCAGLAGAAVPMGLVAVRQDPAQSSSIILTTVTDVVGFFSFLGIATLLADRL